jgi:hypothetical protein
VKRNGLESSAVKPANAFLVKVVVESRLSRAALSRIGADHSSCTLGTFRVDFRVSMS